MPIYEYQCTQCQHVFEEWLHRASEMTNAQTCPQCGGEAHHIMSQTSFILKGVGGTGDDYGYRKNVKMMVKRAQRAMRPYSDRKPAAAPRPSPQQPAHSPCCSVATCGTRSPAKPSARWAHPQAKAALAESWLLHRRRGV